MQVFPLVVLTNGYCFHGLLFVKLVLNFSPQICMHGSIVVMFKVFVMCSKYSLAVMKASCSCVCSKIRLWEHGLIKVQLLKSVFAFWIFKDGTVNEVISSYFWN